MQPEMVMVARQGQLLELGHHRGPNPLEERRPQSRSPLVHLVHDLETPLGVKKRVTFACSMNLISDGVGNKIIVESLAISLLLKNQKLEKTKLGVETLVIS